MSANSFSSPLSFSFSSSSSNLSLHPSPPSSSNASSFLTYECLELRLGSQFFTALCCYYIFFIFPLCIFIVYMGLQRWRRWGAISLSNLDLFTYNVVATEMIGILGNCVYCIGIYTNTRLTKTVGLHISSIIMPGQMLFHILTCMERHLAVNHPVFYRGLRKARGVRLRNGSIGFVWVVSFSWMCLTCLYSPDFPSAPFATFLILSAIVTSFLSISTLLTLIRPGPGEEGGDRKRADRSKRRVIHTIMVVTGALLFRFGGQFVCILVSASDALGYLEKCMVLISAAWFCLPSSYVLPLLFLHRAGKLPCFSTNAESQRRGRNEE